MFNKNFYPTPVKLCEEMLKSVEFKNIKTVLEPSAGKGDLVDYIKSQMEKTEKNRHYWDRNDVYTPDIDCIELQSELQDILKGKGYRLIHDDFLEFTSYKKYDLVILNPPFDCGEDHLLKALDIQKKGGAIICLLNATSIKYPKNNKVRDMVTRLEELGASIEYISDAFVCAERSTNVEVALVKVIIPDVQTDSIIFKNLVKKDMYDYYKRPSDKYTGLIESDFIKAMVTWYKFEIEAGIQLLDEFHAMEPFILRDLKDKAAEPILTLNFNDQKYTGHNWEEEFSYYGFIKRVRQKYWKLLFDNPNFSGKLTDKLKQEYFLKIHDLVNYDFSIFNIYSLRLDLSKQVIKGIDDSIVELFDRLSHKHHWHDETSRNIHYFNGWKTNKSWIINKKVIIPLANINRYENKVVIEDIEKCFSYLDGYISDKNEARSILENAYKEGITKKIPFKYFSVTFYNKGTCHIVFNNAELLKKFNIFGAQRKNWLPPGYAKKNYESMDQEERSVIDEFEGKEEYAKTMEMRDTYLFKSNQLFSIGH